MIRKYFQEPYRPLFHYSSQSNIINDPNGLVWYDGEYHLFHQYNVNNHIHWGHAVSDDLVHWQHLAPALFTDDIGQIWSGSAVVDVRNSAGFQQGAEPAMAALFTYNEHVDAQQSQGLAYSTDRGRTWTMYEQNPVLTGRGQKDFRDPKVFWDTHRDRWAMVLACGDHVEFYASADLKQWIFAGSFGKGIWEGTWECPDLFEMPVKGESGETVWVLTVSMNNGAPAGGTGMRCFIGQFDGSTFVPSDESAPWIDMGKDFYAGVTWNNIPAADGRRLMIAWADNWRYRDDLPTEPFLGQFSCVRELSVLRREGKLCLTQQPNRELSSIRQRHWQYRDLTVKETVRPDEIRGKTLDMHFSVLGNADSSFRIKIHAGSKVIPVGYQFGSGILSVDRRGSSDLSLPDYQERYEARLDPSDCLDIRILLDRSQMEVFADGGRTVLTCLLFPDNEEYSLELCSDSGEVLVRSADIYELGTVWDDEAARYDETPFSPISGQWAHTVSGIEGYCRGTGIALLPCLQDKRNWAVKVKIKEYADGARAGLLLDEHTGLAAFLDGTENKLILSCNGEVIAEAENRVNRNRVYKLGVQTGHGTVVITLDDVPQLHADFSIPEEPAAGLYVDGSFAYFLT